MDTTKIKNYMRTDAHFSDADMAPLKQNFKDRRVDSTRQISDSEINEVVLSTMKNMGAAYLLDQEMLSSVLHLHNLYWKGRLTGI